MSRSFISRVGGTNDAIAQLTQAEQDNNILCIMDELEGNYGWSKIAIAGACGCFHEESHFNPGIYETGHGGTLNNLPYFPGGMGLAQWTDYRPYTGTYPNPLPFWAQRDGYNWYDGIYQCYLMTKCTDPVYTDMGYGQGARWGWLTSSSYPSIPFSTYLQGNMSVADAVKYWFYDFEWHWSEVPPGYIEARTQWGEYAYQLMQGQTPDPPGPAPQPYPGNLQGFINWCIQKCNDPNVGYSQAHREEETINGITYYDCSSFIWYGLKHNDFDIDATGHPTYAFNTTAMPTDLPLMGFHEIDKNGVLQPGDIGVTTTHAEVCYEGGSGGGIFMGAHNDSLPLAEQVSINDYASQGTDFDSIWRFGGSVNPQPIITKSKMPFWMMLRRLPF